MSAGELLLPPSMYSWWVPSLGVLALGLVAGWLFWVLRSTRAEPEAPKKSKPASQSTREGYAGQISEALGRYHSGEFDLRALHLELAKIMRAYASERIGKDVSTWTRRDVSEYDPTSRLGELLEVWEEPSFAEESDAEAEAAARAATRVVMDW